MRKNKNKNKIKNKSKYKNKYMNDGEEDKEKWRQEEEKDIEVIIILPSILLRYGTKNIEGKEHIVHIKKFV